MFENLLGSLKSSIKEHFDKKKEQQEEIDRMNREAKILAQQVFQDEFKKNALEVARAEAKKDAAKKSGLQKLRAMNRANRLTEPANPGGAMAKFSEYTQKNLLKREENIKRTKELREEGKKMREERMLKKVNTGKLGIENRRTQFGSKNFGH